MGLLEGQRPLGFRGEAGECPQAAPWAASVSGPCGHAKGTVARRVKQPLKGPLESGLEQRTAGQLPRSQAGIQSPEKQGWGARTLSPKAGHTLVLGHLSRAAGLAHVSFPSATLSLITVLQARRGAPGPVESRLGG